ncbi:MAG: extracellular solute-binding protein [Alphaproteobacteria bacterium]|nr:extracellular solute-binding protein [Alphaproteobacteria bacterium]
MSTGLPAALVALAAAAALALPAAAQAPAPSKATPELIAAAKAEGKVSFYTSIEIKLAERLGKAFEAKYPGIKVQVERSGAERNFQRIMQEYGSNIRNADVIESSDAAHVLVWKRNGWLAPFVPEDVAKWPADQRDPDGTFAANRATLSVGGYNTKQLKPEEAPKSFADMVDAKWQGKIVKAHPGYSGTIMTATFQIAETLGWGYLEKLGKQKVMQVQSATDPPKKLASGERQVMADGVEYLMITMKKDGAPVEIIYPSEGTPLVAGMGAVLKAAPNPNAARLFAIFLFSQEGQQIACTEGGLRSFHPGVVEPGDRVPFAKIKTMKADPVAQEKAIEATKAKYTQYFGT